MGIEDYVNKVSAGKDTSVITKAIDKAFASMNSGDKIGTSDLVSYLKDAGVAGIPEKSATDLITQAAIRTTAVSEGSVVKEKLGTEKYARIVFTKQ